MARARSINLRWRSERISIEAAVLLIEEFGSEFVFGGGPFLQGFGGDVEAGVDEFEVAVELFEEVERLDFVVERVAFWHGVCPSGCWFVRRA